MNRNLSVPTALRPPAQPKKARRRRLHGALREERRRARVEARQPLEAVAAKDRAADDRVQDRSIRLRPVAKAAVPEPVREGDRAARRQLERRRRLRLIRRGSKLSCEPSQNCVAPFWAVVSTSGMKRVSASVSAQPRPSVCQRCSSSSSSSASQPYPIPTIWPSATHSASAPSTRTSAGTRRRAMPANRGSDNKLASGSASKPWRLS